MIKSKILIFLIILVSFLACKGDRLNVDVSGIDVDIQPIRFDNDLFAIDTSKIVDAVYDIHQKYGEFWEMYTYQILNIGGPNDRMFADRLCQFLGDPVIRESYEEAQKIFENDNFLIEELDNSFTHFAYYFPEKEIPKVFTFIGGFNQSIVTDKDLLGIGLDKYLGEECRFYYQLGLPVFARKQLKKENIASDCMRAWAMMEFPNTDSIENVLNTMIYNGKILYFAKAMMPEKSDTVIIRYSTNELDYCVKSEKEMYAFMVENEFLFSTKYKDIVRFTKDGPFTAGFKNSPARVGNWIGWQIVKKYVDQNPTISLNDLMEMQDHQGIFIASKYNP
ncbi:MAG: hypothetical protein K9H64_05835 [Bacteroidales bacterium]|nr:hypothetical protein [Bacteroidales bacterium]MCF8455429.1 hypothetical protein [Bacteroidales bacterium]